MPFLEKLFIILERCIRTIRIENLLQLAPLPLETRATPLVLTTVLANAARAGTISKPSVDESFAATEECCERKLKVVALRRRNLLAESGVFAWLHC